MDIIIVLAAVLFSAILRALWIKKHGKAVGMEKKEARLGRDRHQ